MSRKTKTSPKGPAVVSQANEQVFQNGLADIIGAPNISSEQVSQTDTLTKSCRWYLVSNQRNVLSQLYVEHGLVQTICDVPVDDAFRGGYDIKTKQLSAEDIDDLHAYVDEIGLNGEIGQSMKWSRLYGGGGILILTDQDSKTPLDMGAVSDKSKLEFRAVDMWELFWDKQTAEGYNPAIQTQNFEFYNYYGMQVHHSRVLAIKGKLPPSHLRPQLRGWGFSVVESLIRSINQYLKTNNLTFEVLDEFKLDIFKIKGLTQALMTAGGTTAIQKRVALANQQKNYQNALTMDIDDDYQSKQLAFTGIAEVMKEIRMQVASDMRMPMSKLFGISASGFSSGEDDIEVYNGMVESEVRAKAKHPTIKMLKLLCKKKFGIYPDDLQITYRPLRILSAEQEEQVKTNKFTRLMAAYDKGLVSAEEVVEAINRDSLLPIQVSTKDVVKEMAAEEEEGT